MLDVYERIIIVDYVSTSEFVWMVTMFINTHGRPGEIHDQRIIFFFFQAEDGIRDLTVTGVQTCALPICALSGFAELLRQRRVELAVNCAAAVPEIRVDPMRLEQALTEIVSNALDAMPDGGRLEIGARAQDGAAGATGVMLEIADSGRGIPPEILPNLCEPFFTTRPEGTGLGLAIAKRYIEEAGGRVDIVSTVGRGTTVRLWLPVATGDVAPEPVRSLA